MMCDHSELSKISQVTNNIFLSGIFPLDQNFELIKKLNIKYILACLDRNDISEIHDKIMLDSPETTILYLPYLDDIGQNLWKKNENQINIIKYTSSIDEYNRLINQINFYNNKPMIEIGYHFIEYSIASGNRILVHCMAGVSRSVSCIIYYMMKKYHVDYDSAYDSIKNRRNIINPNDSFVLQLKEYQNKREKFSETDANAIIVRIKQFKIK